MMWLFKCDHSTSQSQQIRCDFIVCNSKSFVLIWYHYFQGTILLVLILRYSTHRTNYPLQLHFGMMEYLFSNFCVSFMWFWMNWLCVPYHRKAAISLGQPLPVDLSVVLPMPLTRLSLVSVKSKCEEYILALLWDQGSSPRPGWKYCWRYPETSVTGISYPQATLHPL